MMHARFQDIKKKDIHRLVVSEMGHVNEEATLRAYEESGIEKYEYMATLESHTCDICARLDGHIFKLSDRRDGINYPIIHPRCRCTTIPHIDGLPETGERWMRDADTGKGKLVKSISFKEWNRKYGNINIYESGSAFRNGTNEVNLKYISSTKYRNKFSRITDNSNVNDVIRRLSSGMLTKHSGTDTEDLHIIHSDTGKILIQLHGGTGKLTPGILNDDQKRVLNNNKGKTIAIHNHPTNVLPDGSDYQALMTRRYDKGIIVGHDGSVFEYGCTDSDIDTVKARQLQRMLDNKIANLLDYNYNMAVNKAFEKAIKSLERGYKIWFEKIT